MHPDDTIAEKTNDVGDEALEEAQRRSEEQKRCQLQADVKRATLRRDALLDAYDTIKAHSDPYTTGLTEAINREVCAIFWCNRELGTLG